MNDSSLVKRTQRITDLSADGDRGPKVEGAVAAQTSAQRLAVHKLHRVSEPPWFVLFNEIVDVDEAGMIRGAGRANFVEESLNDASSFDLGSRQHLQGDHASAVDVSRFKNGACTALPQNVQKRVGTNDAAGLGIRSYGHRGYVGPRRHGQLRFIEQRWIDRLARLTPPHTTRLPPASPGRNVCSVASC